MGIVHETGRKVKGDKRAAVSGFSHQTSDAGPDEFGMTQPLDKLEFGGDAPAGNASLRPCGSLPILWARPVRFCGGGLFYITYAVPVEGPKGCGMSTRSP